MTLKLRVPARLSRILVQTDLVFLERVLRNLIVNALRYTANGGIALSLVTRKDYIEFRVVDTGPGIEPALRERIFEEFFQVPGSQISAQRSNPIGREARPAGVRPANRESRIGLGLTISARLAEGLGTQIRVKSRVGKGSVFYFRQPFRTVIRSVEQAMPDPLAEKFTSASLPKGLFVAVIDDDPDVRKSTSELLMTFLEADVYSYDNAEDALAQLGREGRVPGFIISDYGLPGRDGLYAIEALRDEFNAEIPALLITGDNTVASIERFKTARLNHLIKPVTGPVLIAAIGTAMSDAATATS